MQAYPTEGSYLAPEGMFIIKDAKNLEAVVAAWNQAVARAK